MSGEDCDPLHVASILDVLVLIERALVGYLVFSAGDSLHDELTLKLGCHLQVVKLCIIHLCKAAYIH